MDHTVAPQPASNSVDPGSRSPGEPKRTTWVLVTAAILGGVMLLGVAATATIAGISSLTGASRSQGVEAFQTRDVHGIERLDIDAGSADFSVVFDGLGGADSARLEVLGGQRQWEIDHTDGTLRVEQQRTFSFDWFSYGPRARQEVVLHLPERLRTAGLDVDLDLSSGSLSVEGRFGEVEAEASSGSLSIGGSAQTFDVDLSSGFLTFDLEDVSAVDIGVSSGQVRGSLTGRAPVEIEVSVSSGSVDLAVPNASYAVSSRVSSGRFDNQLRTDPASRNTIDVRVSSGKVTLRPGE